MLDCHWDTKPDSASALCGVGQKAMLKHKCARFKARIILNDLLIHIQQCAHRAITYGMCANPPTPAHCEISQGKQVVRIPEQVPTIARIVRIGIVEGTSFSTTVE